MLGVVLSEFLAQYKVPRAVCWHAKAKRFVPRAYSGTAMALKANEDFEEFKNRSNFSNN